MRGGGYPWGKRYKESGTVHLLEHHCADVAACFEALLRDPVLRSRFDTAIGPSGLDSVTESRLAVLAFLHDFGKLNTGFQFQHVKGRDGAPAKKDHITAALLACRQPDVVAALGLSGLAVSWGAAGLQELLLAALGHHGRPPRLSHQSGSGPPNIWQPFQSYDPLEAARTLQIRTREWFPGAFESGTELQASPALVHLFAGVVAIADQIGSNEKLFAFERESDPAYINRARQRAREAVRAVGMSRVDWNAGARSADVKTLFGHDSPRPLQKAVEDVSVDCPLLILESETGSGKTEAAVLRFAKLWQAGLVDGFYFALPTRAAAVQIHGRIQKALVRLFPTKANLETVLALPGYQRAGEATGQLANQFDVKWHDDPDEERRLARWSAESARKFLCATAAVGTVDQALLSGLMTKWAHFRGSALARSLLVVDEVHASDAYMTEVLRGVLQGHLKVGGHALLMSATLGATARDALVGRGRGSHTSVGFEHAQSLAYPALTVAERGGGHQVMPFDGTRYSKSVSISTEPIMADPARIAKLAVTEARSDAKVLVVRNTVALAQAVYREVIEQGGEALCLQAGGGPALHHSRFAVEDRKLLDRAVETAVGKKRDPGGRIVVGTQTLEQSLDIDADVLLSDLCPVDVLLQRIGRLHRHPRVDRPETVAQPRCIVMVPRDGLDAGLGGGLVRYGLGMSRNGGIYRDLRGLEMTRQLVESRSPWIIPKMNRELVESGTHPESLLALEKDLGVDWEDQAKETDGRVAAERKAAGLHFLNRGKGYEECSDHFPDSDERVRTRLGDDGPRIRLSEPVPGPFGRGVTTFNLPGHLFRGGAGTPSKEEIEGATAEAFPGGLILRVGERSFSYDRTGVAPGASPL